MPKIRRRIRKEMRKRYGKSIKLSQVDKVWAEYVEYGIVAPLLKYGEVKINDKTGFEIVGTRILQDNRLYSMFLNNRLVRRNNTVNNRPELNTYRPDVVYNIRLKDGDFKEGKLYFEADEKIRKKLVDALKNTNTYYKILNDVD